MQGGGQLHHDAGVRMTAKEVLAAGPVRARVLFGVQEGWPFYVPLKKGTQAPRPVLSLLQPLTRHAQPHTHTHTHT